MTKKKVNSKGYFFIWKNYALKVKNSTGTWLFVDLLKKITVKCLYLMLIYLKTTSYGN